MIYAVILRFILSANTLENISKLTARLIFRSGGDFVRKPVWITSSMVTRVTGSNF